MFFRASLFGAFGESKRWLGKNADGTSRPLATADFYKAGAITGFIAAFTEGPIDFYKSQMQVRTRGRLQHSCVLCPELFQYELHVFCLVSYELRTDSLHTRAV